MHLLHNDSAPSVQCPARTVPIARRSNVKEELDKMVKRGVILPVDEPVCRTREKE